LPTVSDWSSRDYRVINAARLAYDKNQMMLIRAFATVHNLYPQYSLEMHNEGAFRAKLVDSINQLKAESYIKLMPSTKSILDIMNNARIYVCSSNNEGYSNALLEAMAMGMACISTDCAGSVREMIEDGVNGLVVPVDNEEAMTEALKLLMENDAASQDMAERATKVRELNAKDNIIRKWTDFFKTIIEET